MASSVAALVMVVAVMAGTCASGANAQKFNITNLCKRTITISTGSGNAIVASQAELQLSCPPATFFVGTVTITIHRTRVPVPSEAVSFLSSLFGLNSIAVDSCHDSCVTFLAAFTVLSPVTVPLGPICVPKLPPPPSNSVLPPGPSLT